MSNELALVQIFTAAEIKEIGDLSQKITSKQNRVKYHQFQQGRYLHRIKTLFKKRIGRKGGAYFEKFVNEELGIKKRMANERIQGYRVHEDLKPGKFQTLPANTSITTELGRLLETRPEKLVDAWRESLVRCEASGKTPTSVIVREVVAQMLPPTPGTDAQPSTRLGSKPGAESKAILKHLSTARKEIASILDAEPSNESTVAIVGLIRDIEKMAKLSLPRWESKLPGVATKDVPIE
jgi:hypothetical protein